MTADLELTADPYDARLARSATGLLRTFNEAGVLTAADVHVAARLGRLGAEPDERVQLAAALAVRGVRMGSVCLELADVRHTVTVDGADPAEIAALPWPEPVAFLAACTASPLVAVGVDGDPGRPLRLVDGRLYLDRYWRHEETVRSELDRRALAMPEVDADRLRTALQRLFPDGGRQALAAALCALRSVTVLAGGPGTGKTTTVARLLALLLDVPGQRPRIALAAPTGKAAARMQEAVRAAELPDEDRARLGMPTASTLHRLLGSRPDSRSRFRHDRTNRLPYDVVIVDETSMVSLGMMSRLLDALRPEARLVLVGDPDQLASVEAGAVLGDLVARAAGPDPHRDVLRRLVGDEAPDGPGVVRLVRNWRFRGGISALADAVRRGAADETLDLLRAAPDGVTFVDSGVAGAGVAELRADIVAAGGALTTAARAGDVDGALAALDRHRLLCAHRTGPYGVAYWSAQVEAWLAAAIDGYAAEGGWYPGRPLLVTANDYDLRLYNGDTGVVVDTGVDGVLACFGQGDTGVRLPPSRLAAVQTVHAMTVHRSQGSQFERVSVLLPPVDSPLLTRELLYTAITRAASHVRLLATEEAVRAAVDRPVVRASGLRGRPPR